MAVYDDIRARRVPDMIARIDHVEIHEPDNTSGWSVTAVWADVDRPRVEPLGVGSGRMARRLKRAILAGKVYPHAMVVRDLEGRTYVFNFPATIRLRSLDASLKQLGF